MSLNMNTVSLIEKFGYIIIVHIFILIPIMYFWSHNRNWQQEMSSYNSWSSPTLYLDLTIALIYPIVFAIYISCIRYLRLGSTLDLKLYFTSNIFIIIGILLFMLPYVFAWFILLMKLILQVKRCLWDSFYKLILSFFVYILKYRLVFFVFKCLYELSFLWVSFLIHDAFIYRKHPQSSFRKWLHRLYLNPGLFIIFVVLIAIVELLLNKGVLYYSLLSLMVLVFMKPFIYFLNTFNGPINNWIELCCYSNYINLNWNKPYYERQFWLMFNEMRQILPLPKNLSEKEEYRIEQTIEKWNIKDDTLRDKHHKLYLRLLKKQKISFLSKIRFAYRDWTRIY